MPEVTLSSIVHLIKGGLLSKDLLANCVDNPQKTVDELSLQDPNPQGLIQCSSTLFNFPPAEDSDKTNYQFLNCPQLTNFEPIHYRLAQYEDLNSFDLKMLKPDQHDVGIQQQLIKRLQDFIPHKYQLPYVPHIILPVIPDNIDIIFSIERSNVFQQFEQVFTISPFFSADELACIIFNQIPGITQE